MPYVFLCTPSVAPGAARALASTRSALSCARSPLNGREEAVPAWCCLFLLYFVFFFVLCPLFRCPQALVLDLAARVHKCTRAAYPPARSVTNGLERIVPLGTILSSSFSLLAAVLPLPIPLLFPGAVRALASARSALSCARSLSNGREEAVPARYCLFTHFFFVFFSSLWPFPLPADPGARLSRPCA